MWNILEFKLKLLSQRDGGENYNNAKNIYGCRPSSLF